MNFEARNEYGFPIPDKLQRAREYAAGAAQRKQARECMCDRCKEAQVADQLQSVLNILSARQ